MTNDNHCSTPRQVDGSDYKPSKVWPLEWSLVYQAGPGGTSRFDVIAPDTFFRGTGVTIEQAEEDAWRQYERSLACTGHVFETRGFGSGAGWCVHCDMFSPNAFEPERSPCTRCGRPTAFLRDAEDNAWCMTDWREMPVDKRTDAWRTFNNRPASLAGYIKSYRAKFKEPTV